MADHHISISEPSARGRTAVVSGGGPGGAAAALLLAAHLTSGPARVGRDLLLRAAARPPSDRQARRLYQENPAELRDASAAIVAADQIQGR